MSKGLNHAHAKLASQDTLSGVTAGNFLYGVSLPTQIAMEIKQEGPAGRPGANPARELLRPRPSGEAKVPSPQECGDCCGNGLRGSCPRSACSEPLLWIRWKTGWGGEGRGQATCHKREGPSDRVAGLPLLGSLD